jgi:nitrogen fixation protein NifB
MGESPRAIFARAGITPVTMSGFIEAGLKAVYSGKDLSIFKRRAKKSCDSGCVGTGTGCG